MTCTDPRLIQAICLRQIAAAYGSSDPPAGFEDQVVRSVAKKLAVGRFGRFVLRSDVFQSSSLTDCVDQAVLHTRREYAIVQAAHAAAHTKGNYLSAQYHHLVGRRGKKKTLVAVVHSILVMAYHIIKRKQPYQDPGGTYFDPLNQKATAKRLMKRIEKLG